VDDWEFTPADYQALGGHLTFGRDSDWVPECLKRNLLATLRWALDPGLDPPVTGGVSVKDFYHGHLVCRRPCDPECEALFDPWEEARKAAYADGLDGRFDNSANAAHFDPVTDQNLAAFSQALREAEKLARPLVECACLDREGNCAVIYHTYEPSLPRGMDVGDPRRNIRTMFVDDRPMPYRLPNPNDVNSYDREYCHLLQFAFLVDERGAIHVTTGSTRQLSRVVNRPLI
jgi:hypothetical protein